MTGLIGRRACASVSRSALWVFLGGDLTVHAAPRLIALLRYAHAIEQTTARRRNLHENTFAWCGLADQQPAIDGLFPDRELRTGGTLGLHYLAVGPRLPRDPFDKIVDQGIKPGISCVAHGRIHNRGVASR